MFGQNQYFSLQSFLTCIHLDFIFVYIFYLYELIYISRSRAVGQELSVYWSVNVPAVNAVFLFLAGCETFLTLRLWVRIALWSKLEESQCHPPPQGRIG